MRRSLMTAIPGLLKPRVSGVTPIVWLLRDEFLTDEAAPLASPRTAEPGPGTLTLVQNDDGQMSISDGKLLIPVQVTPAWGDQGFYGPAMARIAGRALVTTLTWTVRDDCMIAWQRSASLANSAFNNIANAFYMPSSGQVYSGDAQVGFPFSAITLSANTVYDVAVVLRTSGAFLLLKGGTFTVWTLLWVSGVDNSASVYASISNYDGAESVEFFGVRDLPAPFDTDYGIASVNVATPVSGTSYTATADAITDMEITLPESPSSGDRMELRYRVQDDDNYMVFYARYSGSAWDVRIDKVEGGSATQLLNVTNVGTPDTLRVITDGNRHDAYTKSGTTWTRRNGQINNSFNAALTTIKPVFEVGSVGSLRSYPRTSPAYAELDRR